MKLLSKDGRALEREILGIAGSEEMPEFKEFWSAVQEAKIKQLARGTLSNSPKTTITKKLFQSVRRHLCNRRDQRLLEFYVAIGSALDVYHGIDMFFQIRSRIVTLDLTRRVSKEDAKADFLLTADMIEKDQIEELGKTIADIFNR